MNKLSSVSLACSAVLAIASISHANLLVNGSFETGDFTGWTIAGESEVLTGSNHAHAGNYGAALGEGIVSQAVVTTAGHVYDLSFYLKQIPDGGTGPLTLEWDSWNVPPGLDYGAITLLEESDLVSPTLGWAKYDFHVLALGNIGTVKFEFQTQASSYPENVGLDELSLTDTGALHVVPILRGVQIGLPSPVLPNETPYLLSSSITLGSPVPEPSTYGLLGAIALAGVVALRRRRQV